MKRFALFALVSLALAAAASAQNKPLTKVVYTLTTKDVSVGLSAHTSLPLTLGYWKAEGLDVEVTTLDGSTAACSSWRPATFSSPPSAPRLR